MQSNPIPVLPPKKPRPRHEPPTESTSYVLSPSGYHINNSLSPEQSGIDHLYKPIIVRLNLDHNPRLREVATPEMEFRRMIKVSNADSLREPELTAVVESLWDPTPTSPWIHYSSRFFPDRIVFRLKSAEDPRARPLEVELRPAFFARDVVLEVTEPGKAPGRASEKTFVTVERNGIRLFNECTHVQRDIHSGQDGNNIVTVYRNVTSPLCAVHT